MLFNSFTFALFFPLVAAVFWVVPRGWRPHVLLAASLAFYSWWKLSYGALLMLTTALDWWVVGRMARAPVEARGRWLTVTLCSNFGLLFVFKYWNLFNGTASAVVPGWPIPDLALLLPLGISFYTFQTMSYAVDVYRGTIPAVSSLPRFALFVWFFPQLVAGPIERAPNLLPQLERLPDFDAARVVSGLREAAWGMFKKVVVADRLAFLVNAVYASPTDFQGFGLAFAATLFGFQVYYDFAGYSEIARGVARVFGVELMKNFNQPFRSTSMTEWWQHWHISLSTWFRDYLYFPLGGSRLGPARWALATMVVFVVSGLWHGASWTYLLWGVQNGAVLLVDRWTRPWRDRVAGALGIVGTPRFVIQVVTTGALWALLLVPFRAESFSDAVYVYTHLHVGWRHVGELAALGEFLNRVDLEPLPLLFGLTLIPLVETVDALRRRPAWVDWWRALPPSARWSLDWGVLFGVLFFGCWVDSPFVYFQF